MLISIEHNDEIDTMQSKLDFICREWIDPF